MKYTKCWTCKKCYGQCSWSSNFIPVEGWTAIPTTLTYRNIIDNSFLVLDCPEYMDDGTESYIVLPKSTIAKIIGTSDRTLYRYTADEVIKRLSKHKIKAIYNATDRHFYVNKNTNI